MSFVTGSWLVDILIAISLILLSVYLYWGSVYSYWKDRNVPYIKLSRVFGDSINIFIAKKANADAINEVYQAFEGERFVGLFQFTEPALMIRDPKLIELILVKDFSHFEDRKVPLDLENEPLTMNLVNLKGEQWRGLRYKLSPTFSSGKLKGMFQQICKCGEDLLESIEKYAATGEVIDTKQLMFLFSSDVIASCAFGLQFKEIREKTTFREMINRAFGDSTFIILRFVMKLFYPRLATFLGVKVVPADVHEYFMGVTRATMEHRLKNNVRREDFFQMLLTLKEREETNKPPDLVEDVVEQDDIPLQYAKPSALLENSLKFTDELLAAQSFVFLAAGSESVSTTISTVLYFLAEYPDVQVRLQAEVDRFGGLWTYQALKEMTYLDQVIQEAQRIFPIAHVHVRTCTSSYKVPDSDLVIEKGVGIIIPSHSIHMDPRYYPNPNHFDPDRFEGNNFKPSPIYSPFGDGPRMCIALRFAVLEMKIVIARIMSRFSVKPSSKTLSPLRYDPRSFSGTPLGGIWVSFDRRKISNAL